MSRCTESEHDEDAPVLRVELKSDLDAPALARAAVNGFLRGADMQSTTLATLTLLVSEIVTNAVIHPDVAPADKIDLYARVARGLVRVEVTNRGRGFTPTPRDPAQIGGGYGLYLLDKASSRWGVEVHQHTTVWFELADTAA